MSWVIYDFSHIFICMLWFCHGLPKGEIVRTYVVVQSCEHMSLFYVIGLSLDKTHFTCIWVDLGCVKHFKKQGFKVKCWSRQNLSKIQARKCKILKLDTYLDRYIYRALKKLFCPSLDSYLDTFICRELKKTVFQVCFKSNPWVCLWDFFSPNPRHIKGLF